jgi:hypothetical protein
VLTHWCCCCRRCCCSCCLLLLFLCAVFELLQVPLLPTPLQPQPQELCQLQVSFETCSACATPTHLSQPNPVAACQKSVIRPSTAQLE